MSDEGARAAHRPRRSLMLAGGGVKVAFQAGALQVLLDETDGLEFDHADGASGGSFNLAMLCQGQSGRQIADNWRRFGPLRTVQPNWRLLFGESIARTERLIDVGFTDWGLDFDLIRSSDRDATFNVYDFSRHELVVLEPRDMSAEMLAACISLPMWFPPVQEDGDALIDPVYITDCNVDEAIRRGADELWIIWTVSRRARWRWNFVNQYFQIIETAANGHFKRALRRIDESNRALAEGRHSEFGRQIDYKVLYGEVPLHYLINVRRAPFRRAVDQGVEAARAWCRHEGIPLRAEAAAPTRRPRRVRFTEVMAGSVAFGAEDPEAAAAAPAGEPARLKFRLTIHVDDVERFLADPQHEADAVGFIECPALGGRRVISRGRFNLFTADSDPRRRHMRYRLFFTDGAGRPLTLAGVKNVSDDPGADAWADTTTLYTRILEGHVAEGADAPSATAAGILRISVLGFVRQLTTFRGSGPGAFGATRALLQFGRAFAGNLYRVYGRRLLLGG
jgi:predicted acylesterase/phospholipase RssA